MDCVASLPSLSYYWYLIICFVHVRFVFLSEICNNLQVLYLQYTIYLYVYAPIIQKNNVKQCVKK